MVKASPIVLIQTRYKLFKGKNATCFLGNPKSAIAKNADIWHQNFDFGTIYVLPDESVYVSVHIPVVRPADFVCLDFECVNLDISGNPLALSPLGCDEPSYIIIHFPQQSIIEEAFWEKAKEFKELKNPYTGYETTTDKDEESDPNKEDGYIDPDENKDESDDPTPAPVQSRISGMSRLVYEVPKNAEGFELTLENLLNRCSVNVIFNEEYTEFPLIVSAAAPYPDESGVSDLAASSDEESDSFPTFDRSKLNSSQAAIYRRKLARLKRNSELSGAYWAASVREGKTELNTPLHPTPEPLNPSIQREIVPPKLTQTAIEAPFRLIISPNNNAAWSHQTVPVISKKGRTELWHSRLCPHPKLNLNDNFKKIRAVWAKDLKPVNNYYYPNDYSVGHFSNKKEPNLEFRTSLDSYDRHNIVHLSSNQNMRMELEEENKTAAYIPRSIYAKQLMLSSLGAWLNLRGDWPEVTGLKGLSVMEWKHIATMARDHYVRVVYAGFLFPFGHRASLVKVTERKFQKETKFTPVQSNQVISTNSESTNQEKVTLEFNSDISPNFENNYFAEQMEEPIPQTAYLRQRMYIVVTEPTKFYLNDAVFQPYNNDHNSEGIPEVPRGFPFTTVKITSLVTPDLDLVNNQDAFFPIVRNNYFKFLVSAEDYEGNTVNFAVPMMFVDKTVNEGQAQDISLADVRDKLYNKSSAHCRTANTLGKMIAFANSPDPGDTSFETNNIVFKASDHFRKTTLVPKPNFFPAIEKAEIVVPAIKNLIGESTASQVEFFQSYLNDGFERDNETAQIFLKFINKTCMDFAGSGSGDKSGGLVSPNINISAFSRLLGPVGGDPNKKNGIKDGKMDPADFFGDLDDALPKLFGIIKLTDILVRCDFKNAPKFISEIGDEIESTVQTIGELQTLIAQNDKFSSYLESVLNNQITKLKEEEINKIKGIDSVISLIESLLEELSKFGDQDFDIDLVKTTFDLFVKILSKIDETIAQSLPNQSLKKRILKLRDALANIKNIEEYLQLAYTALTEQKLKFTWEPPLESWPNSFPIFEVDEEKTKFYITVEAQLKSKSRQPEMNVLCCLEKFNLNLLGGDLTFIQLVFDKIEFFVEAGKKPEVDVVLSDIVFKGVLSFVNVLQTIIPMDGFSDPPYLDVSAEGIEAGFTQTLPSISVGAFNLQNINIGAQINIPFIGESLSVTFNFCTRENPFLLSVYVFGGDGYFSVTLYPGKDIPPLLEASFSFGICAAMDFSVAKGCVKAVGGIGFAMQDGKADIDAYLHVFGMVEVLSVISASIDLLLNLHFEEPKVVGTAKMCIEVEVACFSKSVEVSCTRKFKGSSGDPSFVDVMADEKEIVDGEIVYHHPWLDYCQAFAN